MSTGGRAPCRPPHILVQCRTQSKAFSEAWLCLHSSESSTAGWPAWARAQPPGCKILGSLRLPPACDTVHHQNPSEGRGSWAWTAPRSIPHACSCCRAPSSPGGCRWTGAFLRHGSIPAAPPPPVHCRGAHQTRGCGGSPTAGSLAWGTGFQPLLSSVRTCYHGDGNCSNNSG